MVGQLMDCVFGLPGSVGVAAAAAADKALGLEGMHPEERHAFHLAQPLILLQDDKAAGRKYLSPFWVDMVRGKHRSGQSSLGQTLDVEAGSV